MKGPAQLNGSDLILHGDARHAEALLTTPDRLHGQLIESIITSPPYYKMINYGTEGEIGTGNNSYQAYLDDLEAVFDQLFDLMSDTGTCVIVADSFRSKGELVDLPGDIWRRMKEKWIPIDRIIWKKDKTRPWSTGAGSRRICEQVMVFGKSRECAYSLDKIRERHDPEAKWFIGWPERYHLRGRIRTEVWEIPIPIQGTWGPKFGDNKTHRHFCPFPVELVANLVEATTAPGDVVVDPFAGSGVVPYVAGALNRRGIGIELNQSFVVKASAHEDAFGDEFRAFKARRQEEEEFIRQDASDLAWLRAFKMGKALAKEGVLDACEKIVVDSAAVAGDRVQVRIRLTGVTRSLDLRTEAIEKFARQASMDVELVVEEEPLTSTDAGNLVCIEAGRARSPARARTKFSRILIPPNIVRLPQEQALNP